MNSTNRSQHLFKILVGQYLQKGLPMSSKTLSAHAGVNLSSATIRKIMAKFEAEGLLTSPHVSSGRVPTQQGLRFFVDSLLTTNQPNPHFAQLTIETVKRQFETKSSTTDLLEHASTLLSSMTQLVSLVSWPKHDQQILRRIEFLTLSPKRVLVILVLNNEAVENRIISLKTPYSKSELNEVSHYLNELFCGKDLFYIRGELLKRLKQERATLDRFMKISIEIAEQALQPGSAAKDFVMNGEYHLLEKSAFSNLETLKKVFEAFTQKSKVLELIDQCLQAPGVQILIGEEGSVDPMGACGVVTAPYSQNGQVVGVLGIIGPTRIPYERVLSIVDVTAKVLSQTLNSSQSPPT